MRTSIILICTLFISNKAYLQIISDHKGNDLFSIQNITGFSLNIGNNSAQGSYSIGSPTNYALRNYLNDKSDEKKTTVIDYNGWIVKAGLKNISQSLSSFFSSINQPTIELDGGYVFNSATAFDWDNLKRVYYKGLPYKHSDYYLGGYLKNSFISYFDTINHQRTVTDFQSLGKLAQIGIKADADFYFSKFFAIAFTLNTGYGAELDNIKNYQNEQSRFYSQGVYEINQSVGNIGGSISPAWNVRFSASGAIFLNFINSNFFAHFLILPSFVPSYSNNIWTQQGGISLNYLAKSYGGQGISNIIPAGGIGVDFLAHSYPSYYISSNFNFGGSPPVKDKNTADVIK